MIDPREFAKAIEQGESMTREIARLTASLHRNRCHPDYAYALVHSYTDPQYVEINVHLDRSFVWEPNREYAVSHYYECWRRKLAT